MPIWQILGCPYGMIFVEPMWLSVLARVAFQSEPIWLLNLALLAIFHKPVWLLNWAHMAIARMAITSEPVWLLLLWLYRTSNLPVWHSHLTLRLKKELHMHPILHMMISPAFHGIIYQNSWHTLSKPTFCPHSFFSGSLTPTALTYLQGMVGKAVKPGYSPQALIPCWNLIKIIIRI